MSIEYDFVFTFFSAQSDIPHSILFVQVTLSHFSKLKEIVGTSLPVAYGDLFEWVFTLQKFLSYPGGLCPPDPPFVAAMLAAPLPITNEDLSYGNTTANCGVTTNHI